MIILHITSIGEIKFSGMLTVVPQHIISQQQYENVGVVNLSNIRLSGVINQFQYNSNFKISALDYPFSKPDIVIFHGVYIKEYIKIYKELLSLKIPYVIIPHGALTKACQHQKVLKKTIANLMMFNSFINGASSIQFLSFKEAESSKCRPPKIISGNGVKIPDKKKVFDFSDKIEFVFIGRMDIFYKGLDLLIKAISKEKQFLIENNCIFNLYGPSSEKTKIDMISLIKECGVEKLVYLHSGVTGTKKENVLLESDIFVQTSRSEGMPMSILEALSYGIPCFVTEGTSFAEIIRDADAGQSAETNIDSIAINLHNMINDKNKMQSWGKNARSLAINTYSWEVIASKTLELYKKVVSIKNRKTNV